MPVLKVTGTTYADTTRDRRWDKAREAMQSASVGGTLGGTAGAIIGAVIGGIFTGGLGAIVGAQWGAALGSLGGSAAGIRKGVVSATDKIDKADLAARRRSIQTELMPLRKAQPRHLTSALNDLVRALADAILFELDSRIDQQRESVRDAMAQLAAAAAATREEADSRLAALEEERRPLQRTRTQRRAAGLRGRSPRASPTGGRGGSEHRSRGRLGRRMRPS